MRCLFIQIPLSLEQCFLHETHHNIVAVLNMTCLFLLQGNSFLRRHFSMQSGGHPDLIKSMVCVHVMYISDLQIENIDLCVKYRETLNPTLTYPKFGSIHTKPTPNRIDLYCLVLYYTYHIHVIRDINLYIESF